MIDPWEQKIPAGCPAADVNGIEIDNGFPDGGNYRVSLDVSRAVDALHTHPFIQMWYVRHGSYRHHFLGTDFLLHRGAFLIVPPHYPHYIDTRGDSELVRCEFTRDFILNGQDAEMKDSLFNLIYLEPVLVATDVIKPYHYFTGETAEEIETRFDELQREYEKHDTFSTAFVRSGIARLFAVIARAYRIEERDQIFSTYRKALDDAFAYINANFTKRIYLDEICRIALMSERSFFYLFKQVMGMPLSKYLQYLRVLRAQELLLETDRTQYDIAKSCGFQSISYFHRVFKKISGDLPGQYRARHETM